MVRRLLSDLPAPNALAAMRAQRWSRQRRHVMRHSALYRALWHGQAPPERLEDLAALPLVTKTMLRQSQAEAPPYGRYLAARPERVMRIHRTSGTTGEPMTIALSARDAALTAEVGGRCFRAAGLGPGDIVAHCLNYQMWMGGYTDHAALEASGATVVPFGVGGGALLIATIRDLGINAIHCTPSYPAVLERVLAERFESLSPRDLGLTLGLFGGEAGLDNAGFRARLEATWGFAVRNANYGVSDVLSIFASQCTHDTLLHFLASDALHAELIDPQSGAARGFEAGSEGELVLTHLAKECQPLVRFRTGDILAVTATAECACGRAVPRFRVHGRSDDMIVVRGVNVFPTAVAGVIQSFAELSGEYRIRLEGPGPYDRLPVELELAPGHDAPSERLAHAIEAALRERLRASAAVVLLPPASLPRTEGKTRRVVRGAAS